MSAIDKASDEATEAGRQSEQFAVLLAAVQAAQQQPAPGDCRHHTPPVRRLPGSPGQWAAGAVGGSVLLLTVAVSAIAIAIGAVAVTVCLLVLRSVWADVKRGR